MKKFLILFLAILASSVAMAYDFSAVAPSGQTLYYSIIDSSNHCVEVVYPGSSPSNPYDGFTAPTDSLTIPSSVYYNGAAYSVTSIGSYAFYGCDSLTAITIPNSIVGIGSYAFYYCNNLHYVNYLGSVDEWCVITFGNYASNPLGSSSALHLNGQLLTHAVISTASYISGWAFYGCFRLTSVTIGNSVTRMDTCAFRNCNGITSLTIGDSLTSIGSGAFFACGHLAEITFGSSVALIEGSAFYGCGALTSVSLPDGLTTIDTYGFRNCTGLTSIDFGHSLTTIGPYAFDGCSALTSITLPSTLTSIGASAFMNCSQLDSVTLKGSTPPTLGLGAFWFTNSDWMIYVSCIAYDAYYNHSAWATYRSRLVGENNINVTINFDEERGMASILSEDSVEMSCDTIVVVYAEAYAGYRFDHWSTGSTRALDTVRVYGDTVITAYFALDTMHVAVVPNDISFGEVEGGGDYAYGDTATATATPYPGYVFVRWDNGETSNPYSFVVLCDTTVTAIFEEDGETGIEGSFEDGICVYASGMSIFVKGAGNDLVGIYDINGRLIEAARNVEDSAFRMPAMGIYMVQVGNHPARKVVVAR